jgi:preprotein translocase subunit YajC
MGRWIPTKNPKTQTNKIPMKMTKTTKLTICWIMNFGIKIWKIWRRERKKMSKRKESKI